MSWGLAAARVLGGYAQGMQAEDERARVARERAEMKAAAALKEKLELERQTKLDAQNAEQTAFQNRMKLADQTRQMGAAGYAAYQPGMIDGATEQVATAVRAGQSGAFGGVAGIASDALRARGAQQASALAESQGGYLRTAMSDQERIREDERQARAAAQQASLAQQATLARERLAAEQQRAQETNETRRMIAGAAAASRQEGAQTRANSRAEQVSMRLRSQYEQNPVVKNAYTIANQLQVIRGAAASPDAASDLSLIFGYMKILDPNSVVRETEFANAENARGVEDSIRNLYNKVRQGTRLTPKQREQFVQTASRMGQQARRGLMAQNQRYASIAEKMGADPSMVVYDPFEELDPTPDAGRDAAPAATAVPPRKAGESWADYKKRTGVR